MAVEPPRGLVSHERRGWRLQSSTPARGATSQQRLDLTQSTASTTFSTTALDEYEVRVDNVRAQLVCAADDGDAITPGVAAGMARTLEHSLRYLRLARSARGRDLAPFDDFGGAA